MATKRTKGQRSTPMRDSAQPRPFPRRKDPAFHWAAGNSELDAWREALAEWAKQSGGRTEAVKVGNTLLDFVRSHPSVAPTPEMACRRAGNGAMSLQSWLVGRPTNTARLLNTAHNFLAWYLDTYLSEPDDNGRPVRSPLHFNPVSRSVGRATQFETNKDPLPTRYLRELRKILTENDWAWAKQFERDWIERVDSETGETVRTWCPVRASVIALKLLLPLRTFQVRMLDSGEGDSVVHTSDGVWRRNTGPHAPPLGHSVRNGFLRRFSDNATEREITGFFVNTNKTADRQTASGNHGYEIPWEQTDVIAIVDQLTDWQTRFNPVVAPLSWSEVADPEVRLCGTVRPGGAHFLMRDPCGAEHEQPIRVFTLQEFWTRLLIALEDRLHAQGDRRPDGSRVRLTRDGTTFNGRTPLFGLHSLRVSLLTALATEGAVPLHILSKVVAGHASIVMTLYYVKTNPAELTRCLTEATAKVDAGEQVDFVRYLASEQRKEEGFVSNDAAGAAALSRTDAGLWKTLSTGICPVGGTRCGDGGARLATGRHAPVPGGALNCTACRFHITGPAFLPGLVARFNAASLSMEGARRERKSAESALTVAEDARFDREQAGHESGALDVARAQSRLEDAEVRLGSAVGTMQASYELVERCKAVASTHEGLNLVLSGSGMDLEAAVRETSQVELWDAVCQSAHIHPCPEVNEATLRRSQALDTLLMRNGVPPLLMGLSDEVALVAGNEMMRLMSKQLGREATLTLIDGRSADIGDLDALVADMVKLLPHDATASSSTGSRQRQ